jgi:hypothetical protein
MRTKDKHVDVAPLAIDTVAEDIFGLNLRGLRSIAMLWRNPKLYFDAALHLDWRDKFTPSIRLWLFFFALLSFFKFWWVGSSDGMIEAYANGFANAGLPLPVGMTYRDVGREAVLLVFGLLPLFQITTTILLALCFPFWGEPTTAALRQRYLFAVIVPSSSLMPAFMTVMMFMPPQHLTLYGLGLAALTWIIDFLTGYRGAFRRVGRGGRIWRATLLSLCVVALNIATTLTAQLIGIILTTQKYGGSFLS